MLALLFEVAVATFFIAFLIHGLKRYKARRLLYSIVVVGAMMGLQEYFVMSLGLYHYNFAILIGNVPLAIVVGWIIVSYVSFEVALRTRSFLVGAIAGSLADLLLEPLAFLGSLWIWRVDNLSVLTYWNAPIGNAFGWLLWCFIGAKLFNMLLKLK